MRVDRAPLHWTSTPRLCARSPPNVLGPKSNSAQNPTALPCNHAHARPRGFTTGGGSDFGMTLDRLINVLASVTLIELMLTIGVGASVADVWGVARDWRGVIRAFAANYVLVPAAA